jgi:hypothetical protein
MAVPDRVTSKPTEEPEMTWRSSDDPRSRRTCHAAAGAEGEGLAARLVAVARALSDAEEAVQTARSALRTAQAALEAAVADATLAPGDGAAWAPPRSGQLTALRRRRDEAAVTPPEETAAPAHTVERPAIWRYAAKRPAPAERG